VLTRCSRDPDAKLADLEPGDGYAVVTIANGLFDPNRGSADRSCRFARGDVNADAGSLPGHRYRRCEPVGHV
jgi:hypothetical protein